MTGLVHSFAAIVSVDPVPLAVAAIIYKSSVPSGSSFTQLFANAFPLGVVIVPASLPVKSTVTAPASEVRALADL